MSILYRSASAGLLILVVFLIRFFMKDHLSIHAFYCLWLVALAKLLLPMELPSSFNLYHLANAVSRFVQGPAPVMTHDAPSVAGGGIPFQLPNTAEGGVTPHHEGSQAFFLLWLGITMLGILYYAMVFIRYRRRFCHAPELHDRLIAAWMSQHKLLRPLTVRSSEYADTPLSTGLLKPTIIMPARIQFDDEQKLYAILDHELIHIRRFDTVVKPLLILACCIHWFNPFVWLMMIYANRDLELSCDEIVLKYMWTGSRKTYATALIDMAEQHMDTGRLFAGFNENAIKERIGAIMKLKSPTILGSIFASLIVIGVSLVFATVPSYADPPKDHDVSPSSLTSITDGNGEVDTEPLAYQSPIPGVEADWMGFWSSSSTKADRSLTPELYYPTPLGTTVYAPAEGIVSEISETSLWPFGRYVVIQATDDLQIIVAHLDSIADLKPGDPVDHATKLGLSGWSGNATIPVCSVALRERDGSGAYQLINLDRWPNHMFEQ